jgi:hypothetical protein
MSDNQRIRQWYMWLGAMLSLAMGASNMQKFANEYEQASLKWDLENEEIENAGQ